MKRIQSISIILALLAMPAAALPCRGENLIRAVIPSGIALNADEVEKAVSARVLRLPGGASITLAVYYYSESVELMGYSDEGPVSADRPGRISVLMKYRVGNELKRVFFLEASGSTRAEILGNLAREVSKALD